jgi:hypothetical protein
LITVGMRLGEIGIRVVGGSTQENTAEKVKLTPPSPWITDSGTGEDKKNQ